MFRKFSRSMQYPRFHKFRGMSLVAVALLLINVARGQQSVQPSAALQIAVGDLVDVQVFNTPEMSGEVRVDQSGNISLPQGGLVRVAGMSPAQAGEAINQSLRNGQIMLDPHVTVFVKEYSSQGVTVLGEVMKPGTYTLLGAHSLYSALSAAGGVTSLEGGSITVTHQSGTTDKQVIRVSSANFSELQQTTLVDPGDTIFVSRAPQVYVVGDVNHPGAFPMPHGEPVNILNLIALAGGLKGTANEKTAYIIRKASTETGTETIRLQLKKIEHNELRDPVLEASDVVYIPTSRLKTFSDAAAPSIAAAAASAVLTALIIR